jgi:hypothetical protein
LDGQLLIAKFLVATDAQSKPTQVVFDAERLGATLAMHLPLRRVVAFLAKIARARRSFSAGRPQQPFHHRKMTCFQCVVRLAGIAIGILWECLAPLADGVL